MARHVIKEGSLVRFASDIELLADQVFKKGKRAEKIAMAKMLLPYIYREQPKAIEATGKDGAPIKFQWLVADASQQRSPENKEGS